MEFTAFACQFCSEHQEWESWETADSAAVWHSFQAHPPRWFAGTGRQLLDGLAGLTVV